MPNEKETLEGRFALTRRQFIAGVAGAAALAAAPTLSAWADEDKRPSVADKIFNRPYITWQNDPCTTATITWQSAEAPKQVLVRFDTEKREGKVRKYAKEAEGRSWTIPCLPGRSINSVELTGLTPGTRYYFVLAEKKSGETTEHSFKTIPNDGSPLRFVAGGDQNWGPVARKLCELAGREAPMFTVIGGDLAYANGDPKNIRAWDNWFKNWMDGQVTPDGLIVPMVLAIGNHETNKLEGGPEVRAPFYTGFFPQGGKTYFSLRFGPLLHLIALDSGHIVPHAEQTAWFKEVVAKNADAKYHIPTYHVPFFPSHREFEGGLSVAGREQWMPIVDEMRAPIAFEHHDHTFKRSYPIRNGEKADDGTVYLGDGCMGVGPREILDPLPWYLEKASSTAHIWVVDMADGRIACRAIDKDGKEFDSITLNR